MKDQRVFWLLLLVTVLNSARAEVIPSYFLNGGKLDLRPTVTPPITSILWKHDGDLLAEWNKDNVPLTYHGEYKGRTTLDIKTGHLEIRRTNERTDVGSYTFEINNEVHGQSYDAIPIKEVLKPSVKVKPVACNHHRDDCILSCEGDTAKAEPVTYTWMMDGEELEETTKELEILKTETEHVKTFSCRMKNPVSQKKSQPKDNPFFQEERSMGDEIWDIFLRVWLHVTIGATGGYVIWQKRDTIKNLICSRQEENEDDDSV